MRHLYMNGGGSAPRGADSTMTSAITSTIARNKTIVRTTFAAVAAFIVVSANPLGAPLGAQQASRTKAPAPPPTPASTVSSARVVTPAVSNDSYNLAATVALRDAPSSTMIGQLQKTTNVEVIAHDRGWSRVRIEGWVPDSVLVPADTSFRANLSAADLRADPAAARGKTVIWNVEFLALQTADPLRQGLADEEPYILARGPNSENALLYLVVPPSLMGTARALQPLARITVTARVRDGRSDPVGIPILDIQTLRRIR